MKQLIAIAIFATGLYFFYVEWQLWCAIGNGYNAILFIDIPQLRLAVGIALCLAGGMLYQTRESE